MINLLVKEMKEVERESQERMMMTCLCIMRSERGGCLLLGTGETWYTKKENNQYQFHPQ